jgi:hypothetical protein
MVLYQLLEHGQRTGRILGIPTIPAGRYPQHGTRSTTDDYGGNMTPLEQKLQDLTRRYEFFRKMCDYAEKTGQNTSAYKKNLAITADEYIKYDMIRTTAGREHDETE